MITKHAMNKRFVNKIQKGKQTEMIQQKETRNICKQAVHLENMWNFQKRNRKMPNPFLNHVCTTKITFYQIVTIRLLKINIYFNKG